MATANVFEVFSQRERPVRSFSDKAIAVQFAGQRQRRTGKTFSVWETRAHPYTGKSFQVEVLF